MTDMVKMRLLKPCILRGIRRLVGADVDITPKKVQWFLDTGSAELIKDKSESSIVLASTIINDENINSMGMKTDREEYEESRSRRRSRSKSRDRSSSIGDVAPENVTTTDED